MADVLGCPDEYTIAVLDRTGRQQLGELATASAATWGRVGDDISDATITIPYQGARCCEMLGDVNPWCNEIGLYRGSGLVWQGPVETVDYGRDDTVIVARDVVVWLVHRVIKELMDYSASGVGAVDLVTIAEALVRAGLDQDDPAILAYVQTALSGLTGERRYLPDASTVYDELVELARVGVNFTALGRRILLTGEASLGRLATLTDDHFIGTGPRVIKDGKQAASAATVLGKGVIGRAGGIGPCGLLETLVSEQEVDQDSADAEAAAIVAAGTFPVRLQVPAGAQLAPDAPITIQQLVPGVTIPVATSQTCYALAADLRLQRLAVNFGPEGETVGVTLVPLGADS